VGTAGRDVGRKWPESRRLALSLTLELESILNNAMICAGFMGIALQYQTARQGEAMMRERFSGPSITAAIAGAAVSVVISMSVTRAPAQAPVTSATAPARTLTTPWGEPDLQGIWTDEFDTPLQRSPRYANQEFFTEEQRADLDKERSAILTRFATEREINGAYNAATFFSTKRTGARTSKIV